MRARSGIESKSHDTVRTRYSCTANETQQPVDEEESEEQYRMEETALPKKHAKLVNSAGIQILFSCRSSGRSWTAVIPSSQDQRSNGLESLRRLESQFYLETDTRHTPKKFTGGTLDKTCFPSRGSAVRRANSRVHHLSISPWQFWIFNNRNGGGIGGGAVCAGTLAMARETLPGNRKSPARSELIYAGIPFLSDFLSPFRTHREQGGHAVEVEVVIICFFSAPQHFWAQQKKKSTLESRDAQQSVLRISRSSSPTTDHRTAARTAPFLLLTLPASARARAQPAPRPFRTPAGPHLPFPCREPGGVSSATTIPQPAPLAVHSPYITANSISFTPDLAGYAQPHPRPHPHPLSVVLNMDWRMTVQPVAWAFYTTYGLWAGHGTRSSVFAGSRDQERRWRGRGSDPASTEYLAPFEKSHMLALQGDHRAKPLAAAEAKPGTRHCTLITSHSSRRNYMLKQGWRRCDSFHAMYLGTWYWRQLEEPDPFFQTPVIISDVYNRRWLAPVHGYLVWDGNTSSHNWIRYLRKRSWGQTTSRTSLRDTCLALQLLPCDTDTRQIVPGQGQTSLPYLHGSRLRDIEKVASQRREKTAAHHHIPQQWISYNLIAFSVFAGEQTSNVKRGLCSTGNLSSGKPADAAGIGWATTLSDLQTKKPTSVALLERYATLPESPFAVIVLVVELRHHLSSFFCFHLIARVTRQQDTPDKAQTSSQSVPNLEEDGDLEFPGVVLLKQQQQQQQQETDQHYHRNEQLSQQNYFGFEEETKQDTGLPELGKETDSEVRKHSLDHHVSRDLDLNLTFSLDLGIDGDIDLPAAHVDAAESGILTENNYNAIAGLRQQSEPNLTSVLFPFHQSQQRQEEEKEERTGQHQLLFDTGTSTDISCSAGGREQEEGRREARVVEVPTFGLHLPGPQPVLGSGPTIDPSFSLLESSTIPATTSVSRRTTGTTSSSGVAGHSAEVHFPNSISSISSPSSSGTSSSTAPGSTSRRPILFSSASAPAPAPAPASASASGEIPFAHPHSHHSLFSLTSPTADCKRHSAKTVLSNRPTATFEK
ncbi:uncharacterized protein CLUP02_14874 [Colletotrichum lupini]|uniref:Uncharacterized protein n=1 Tax=Colletotrichum lupini TaxID=145971 RepID=A0A9Q8WNQ2_9PEZI|nr:uncharacterized protein CLUP02_14874 [Colletotrichum lupini]UQC89345.1 hypothetical protein CLUP02_14874 [Colletotrichum lupini]